VKVKPAKQILLEICLAKPDESIASLSQAIDEARIAQKEETKSSAGDKYETTREMMTQEIEKNSGQIEKLLADRNRLIAIAQNETTNTVQQGSVVITNHGNFYLAVSIGVIVSSEGMKCQTISTSSPIGHLMLNKKAGDWFRFHDKEYIIEEIS
jgi:transcription elongation GreA/GreB family factor